MRRHLVSMAAGAAQPKGGGPTVLWIQRATVTGLSECKAGSSCEATTRRVANEEALLQAITDELPGLTFRPLTEQIII